MIEVPIAVSSILGTLLQKAGVKVGNGGIWVGAQSEEDAARCVRRTLIPSIIQAFAQLEELQGLDKDGVPTLKEYEVWLEAQMDDEDW